jgi:hypothetical protein
MSVVNDLMYPMITIFNTLLEKESVYIAMTLDSSIYSESFNTSHCRQYPEYNNCCLREFPASTSQCGFQNRSRAKTEDCLEHVLNKGYAQKIKQGNSDAFHFAYSTIESLMRSLLLSIFRSIRDAFQLMNFPY